MLAHLAIVFGYKMKNEIHVFQCTHMSVYVVCKLST